MKSEENESKATKQNKIYIANACELFNLISHLYRILFSLVPITNNVLFSNPFKLNLAP